MEILLSPKLYMVDRTSSLIYEQKLSNCNSSGMPMKFLNIFSIVTTVCMMGSEAFASNSLAVVSFSTGKVLVSHGNGFLPVEGIVDLKAGDVVMVGEESSASVRYRIGCTVSVAASTVLKISSNAPCVAGADDSIVISPVDDHPVAHSFDPNMAVLTVAGAGMLGGVIWAVSNSASVSGAP